MNYVLHTKNLTKIYGNQVAVDHVNLCVESGEIYGLLGRNGAGKTTIMKMMIGISSITEGDVEIFGNSMKREDKSHILSQIGCIIENPGFYPNLTGSENLDIFATLRKLKQSDVKNALEIVGLPYRDKKRYSHYSLGMKQRLGLANAIMHKPRILILDEPINGLDPIGIAEIRQFLKELCQSSGVTILISSHILSEIENLADTVGIIHDGRLLEEVRIKDWAKNLNGRIVLSVSSPSTAKEILKKKFSLTDNDFMFIDETKLIFESRDIDTAKITRILVNSGVDVLGATKEKNSLEDYFKIVTGGNGIG